ncbi:MAG: NAD+ synthase [Desulfurococcaceae archaeon]
MKWLKLTTKDVINIPYTTVLDSLVRFVREYFKDSGAIRVVMGLSGGLDSSVLLALLVKALSPSRVTALILPDSNVTPEEDTKDAVELARSMGVEHHVVYIDQIVEAYRVAPFVQIAEDIPTGNLRARIRMNVLYYYANKYNAVVAGSSDRSELLIGYYTKYGDGAADFLPLGCLYKTQIRELGRHLGLPSQVVYKPSAPRLWKGHTALGELGYSYDEIDLALYALFDLRMGIDDAVQATGLPVELFEKVLLMHRKSRHKRVALPIPSLPWLSAPIREI